MKCTRNMPVCLNTLPQVNDVIFMVAPIQEDVIGIHQEESEEDEENLEGVFASVFKVSVENVGRLRRWQTVLIVWKERNLIFL